MKPQFGPDRPSDAYPLTEGAEVAAVRRLLVPTAPGADPDWVTEVELYGVDDPAELARIRAAELEDLERWGSDPFGGA